MKKLVAALLLLTTTLSFGQEKVLLRYNYKKGDNYKVTANIAQKMGTMMDMNITMDMSFDISTVTKEGYTSDVVFDQVLMNMEMNGQKMKYDSKTKEAEMDPFSKGVHTKMQPLLDTSILFEYDKLGNISKTEIISGKADITQFKDNMNSIIYPEEAISVGSEWNGKQKTKEGVEINYTYKVTAIKADKITFDISGTIAAMEGDVSGNGIIDRKTGNMDEMNIIMNMSVQGQSIASNIKMTCTKQ